MKKFAVILAGSGVFDGTEIHEATLSLLAIAKNKGSYEIYAPDIDQYHVINHLNGEEMNESRNVLVESARIARGNIKALSDLHVSKFDAILLPGGFGAAKNLSDWAIKGPDASILTELKQVLLDANNAGLPIGALCISPVLLAMTFPGVMLTIGSDQSTADGIRAVGAEHLQTTHAEVVIDEKYKVVTTPCYMLDATITQIADGAENIVKALIKLT